MYLIGIMLLTCKSKEEESHLYRSVYNFIRQNTHLDGVTPLHISCSSAANVNEIDVNNLILFPNAIMCKILVVCGANVNSQDKDYNTTAYNLEMRRN